MNLNLERRIVEPDFSGASIQMGIATYRPRFAATLPVIGGATYFVTALLCLATSRETGGLAALWPPNAILLAAWLLAPPGRRSMHVAACALASIGANALSGIAIADVPAFTAGNLLSPIIAALLLQRMGTGSNAFHSFRGTCRFLIALLVGVSAGATVAIGPMALRSGSFAAPWIAWAISDFLGLLLVTPLILMIAKAPRTPRKIDVSGVTALLWPLAAVALATSGVFAQSRFPLLFVPLAVLMIATFRLGMLGALLGTLIVAVIGTLFLVVERGPVALIAGDIALKVRFFQFYLVVLFATCVPLATALSQRARLARERAESERQHRRIVERSREVIFETDLEGRWTYLNPAWHTVTGFDPTISVGRSFLSVIVAEDRASVLERLAPLYADEIDECRQEVRYLRADGTERWASVRSQRLTDAAGVVIGTYGTLHDVTQRKAAETAQRESEQLYRLLAENSNDMIVRFSLQGVRLYVSPASINLLGYRPEELLGKSPAGEVHPDDRAETIRVCMSLLEGANDPIAVYRQRHKDGHYTLLEATYRLIRDAAGAPAEFIASVRDVARREAAVRESTNAAARLQESHRLLLMAEAVGEIGHWRLDLASQTVFWSDMVCAIHGVEPGYAPRLETAIEVYHPEDRPVVQRLVEQALTTGEGYEFRARIFRPDGSMRRIVSRGRVEHGPHGGILGLFGVFQDVTEAFEANRQLAESHRLLTMAEAVAQLGHWRVDYRTGDHFWSEEVYRIRGVDRAVQPTLEATLATYHPDDVGFVRQTMGQALSTGQGYTLRARIYRPDGTMAHIFVRGEVDRDADGTVTGLFGIVQDISEQAEVEALLKEREERFRLITEQASDMISLHDVEGRCIFMSPSSRAILGLDPAEIIGKSGSDLAPQEDRARIEAHRAVLMNGDLNTRSSVRYRMYRADGTLAWIETAARIAQYRGQDCTIAVSRDVSHQVEVERELEAARIGAEAANTAKSAFLATMSHEIRTPMTGVLGMIELLRDDVEPAERERFFERLEQSARTLMTVLDDVLDYSKIESGNLTIETRDIDLADLAHNVVDLFTGAASRKGLTLTLDAPEHPPMIRGDAVRIQQVLSNLVGNAIKFTETGGVAVRVSRTPIDEAHDRWRIEVVDTGIGVDVASSERLFSPFVQADLSTTRRFGGSGLGLTISKRLVMAMGGTIGVLARGRGGSRFWFELPLGRGSANSAPTAPARVVRSAAGPALRILVAEDNEVNQLLITSLLRRLGHAAICVANGELAVARVAAERFDLVLMDMQMPIMDGVAATRAIRGLGGQAASMPIVALTADALPERRRFYENIGLTDFLAKPIDIARLTALLDGMAPAPPLPAPPIPAPPLPASTDEALDHARIDALRDEMGDDVLDTLFAMIAREARNRPPAIRHLLDQGDIVAAAREAHALRGAAANVGAVALAAAAAIVEQSQDAAAMRTAVAALGQAAYALIDALQSLAPKLPDREAL